MEVQNNQKDDKLQRKMLEDLLKKILSRRSLVGLNTAPNHSLIIKSARDTLYILKDSQTLYEVRRSSKDDYPKVRSHYLALSIPDIDLKAQKVHCFEVATFWGSKSIFLCFSSAIILVEVESSQLIGRIELGGQVEGKITQMDWDRCSETLFCKSESEVVSFRIRVVIGDSAQSIRLSIRKEVSLSGLEPVHDVVRYNRCLHILYGLNSLKIRANRSKKVLRVVKNYAELARKSEDLESLEQDNYLETQYIQTRAKILVKLLNSENQSFLKIINKVSLACEIIHLESPNNLPITVLNDYAVWFDLENPDLSDQHNFPEAVSLEARFNRLHLESNNLFRSRPIQGMHLTNTTELHSISTRTGRNLLYFLEDYPVKRIEETQQEFIGKRITQFDCNLMKSDGALIEFSQEVYKVMLSANGQHLALIYRKIKRDMSPTVVEAFDPNFERKKEREIYSPQLFNTYRIDTSELVCSAFSEDIYDLILPLQGTDYLYCFQKIQESALSDATHAMIEWTITTADSRELAYLKLKVMVNNPNIMVYNKKHDHLYVLCDESLVVIQREEASVVQVFEIYSKTLKQQPLTSKILTFNQKLNFIHYLLLDSNEKSTTILTYTIEDRGSMNVSQARSIGDDEEENSMTQRRLTHSQAVREVLDRDPGEGGSQLVDPLVLVKAMSYDVLITPPQYFLDDECSVISPKGKFNLLQNEFTDLGNEAPAKIPLNPIMTLGYDATLKVVDIEGTKISTFDKTLKPENEVDLASDNISLLEISGGNGMILAYGPRSLNGCEMLLATMPRNKIEIRPVQGLKFILEQFMNREMRAETFLEKLIQYNKGWPQLVPKLELCKVIVGLKYYKLAKEYEQFYEKELYLLKKIGKIEGWGTDITEKLKEAEGNKCQLI